MAVEATEYAFDEIWSAFELRFRSLKRPRAQGACARAEIYDWLTEGFDTADLNAAGTLLDESS